MHVHVADHTRQWAFATIDPIVYMTNNNKNNMSVLRVPQQAETWIKFMQNVKSDQVNLYFFCAFIKVRELWYNMVPSYILAVCGCTQSVDLVHLGPCVPQAPARSLGPLAPTGPLGPPGRRLGLKANFFPKVKKIQVYHIFRKCRIESCLFFVKLQKLNTFQITFLQTVSCVQTRKKWRNELTRNRSVEPCSICLDPV